MGVIKSISHSERDIIQAILKLHCIGPIELDPTYSKGNFYKGIEQPLHKFDLIPQTPDTMQASADSLPFPDFTFNTIMFDPPFLATKGKSLTIENDCNKINKRFGVFPTEKLLHDFYINCLREFYRLLNDDGILIFKCQDKVSSGKQYFSHIFIQQEAIKMGFYPVDIFILLAKNRIVADWQAKNQLHARKYHSYFWVFKKCKKKISYI